jgi:hypothetical protein
MYPFNSSASINLCYEEHLCIGIVNERFMVVSNNIDIKRNCKSINVSASPLGKYFDWESAGYANAVQNNILPNQNQNQI